MAYYENRREHLDGALMLFTRDLAVSVPNSKNHRKQTWYMRLKIAGRKGYVTRSTKLTKYEDAYEFAKGELLRLQHGAKLGHSMDEYTFEKHWNDWFERNKRNGTWKAERVKWHENYFKRYFKDYFSNADNSSMLLNDITAQFAAEYWDWRKDYWKRKKAERLRNYNPKRRGAKTLGTGNAKLNPAVKTLLMEQSALNQIFFDAAERGRIQQVIKMRVKEKDRKPKRRPNFESGSELATLINNLRSYKNSVGRFKGTRLNAWHRLQRKQLYYLVMFSLNSGMRIGEVREMRWSDIKFDIEVDGLDERIAEVRVSKETKKGQARNVQTQPTANKVLKEWREITLYKKKNDWVWFGQKKDANGKIMQFGDLNKSFQKFLSEVRFNERQDGLLYDRDGDRRSIYSLRHTYATMRLEKGDVSIYDLSLNMGCKVKQIENHYSHVVTEKRRKKITQYNWQTEKKQDSDMSGDTFLAEALRLNKAGKLSDEMLLGIVKAGAGTN